MQSNQQPGPDIRDAGKPHNAGQTGRSQGAETVMVVYGTRPEVIKLAPVIRALRRHPATTPIVVNTGQHRELTAGAQQTFGLTPDVDLDLMRPAQHLDALAARILTSMHSVISKYCPGAVVVQGDTTTAMAAALAGFHGGARVAHVEAGLRSGTLAEPFPEEANRRIIDSFAHYLFAPTQRAAAALRGEGHADRVFLTGNTVVDALLEVTGGPGGPSLIYDESARSDEVLVTMHRRESHGSALTGVMRAIGELAGRFPRLTFVFPMHPNPAVREAAAVLRDVSNVRLTGPLSYPDLVHTMRRARLILTDSGGIQEEAPTFGTPVLVLRDVTERPEGVAAGVAKLVGTDPELLVRKATTLLSDDAAWQAMSRASSPYGDGRAAERIAAVLVGEDADEFRP